MNVLVTGGAGYLGTTLVMALLNEGYSVTVFDSLRFGGDALVPFFRNDKFSFVRGDIRQVHSLRLACAGQDVIVHLAALVGMPACDKDPNESWAINHKGTINLLRCMRAPQRVIYASSVSVYGKVVDGLCTEETETNPLSVYGKTKLEAEIALLQYADCVALRFPTLFGVSPRMRTDLMVNEFAWRAVKDRYAVVYEPDARRPFLHVQDAARAVLLAMRVPKGIYIPGDESLNISKRDLAKLVSAETGAHFILENVSHDPDKRDYAINYDKFKKQGFKPIHTLTQGIREVAQAAQAMAVQNPYANV